MAANISFENGANAASDQKKIEDINEGLRSDTFSFAGQGMVFDIKGWYGWYLFHALICPWNLAWFVWPMRGGMMNCTLRCQTCMENHEKPSHGGFSGRMIYKW